jgi:hypothetical protein
MYAGTMFKRFQISDLAFIAVEFELLKYGEGLGILSDDIGNNHVLCDHGAHLVGDNCFAEA